MKLIQKPKILILPLATLCLVAGLYILILVASPQIRFIASPYSRSTLESTPQDPLPEENYLYIPKLGLLVPFNAGDKSALDKGAWWRFPERGDPEKGGNFILSGHRFKLGWTPQHTKKQSPFYHVDQLVVGDEITVHFNGKDYHYQVKREYSVKPNDTDIEAPSSTPKLTIYTCTLKGSADGRTIIEAEPLARS